VGPDQDYLSSYEKILVLVDPHFFESAGSGFESEYKSEKMKQIKEKREEKVPVDLKCWIHLDPDPL
jgi:hypothetical protein